MTTNAEYYGIIIRPIVTEKSSQILGASNTYAFEVAPGSNKHQIARAVKEIWGVKVTQVRTMNVKGRKNRRNRYGYFDERGYKKALVTVEKGQEIPLA